MNAHLDELVARAAPISDDELAALQIDEIEAELRAEIMRAPRAAPRRGRRLARPRVRIAGALAVAACAALVLAATAFLGADRGTQRAWAAEAVRVAETVPRLLIGEPGWRIERADEFSVDFGEMTFARGERRYDLKWNRAGADGRKHDREARVVARTRVLGRAALVYRVGPGGADDYLTAVWRQDGYLLELRAGAPGPGPRSAGELVALLHTVRTAGVDEWLAAMPASVVLPVDREQVVRAMLAGIPVPAGLDTAALTAGESVRDRYQLGARVAGAAACGWIAQWAAARRGGDRAAQAQAVRAMRSSRGWRILREMQAQGAFPQVVWQYADAIAGSGTVLGGKTLTVEKSYSAALGCDAGG